MTLLTLAGQAPGLVARFAPSPTGALHLGHAFAALTAENAAKEAGGRFLLRIEDLDEGRVREDFVTGIFVDLAWLGLRWEEPVRRQSAHRADYAAALGRLEAMGVLYPCFCTRKDIAAELAQSVAAPQGPSGPVYPGTCRALSAKERAARLAANVPYGLRLDMAAALRLVSAPLRFQERGAGPGGESGEITACPERHGDIVLARKDTPASYHLCVVVDDALQGVTLVTRGEDLFEATAIHRLLQALLRLPVPDYLHHRLIRDEQGRRLAKRDQAKTLRALREEGFSPEAIRALVGLT